MYFFFRGFKSGVPVDSPQNQLAPTNSPHIDVNLPQPTRPTFIPTRPTYMPTHPTNSPHIYTNLPNPNPTILATLNIIIYVYEFNDSEI